MKIDKQEGDVRCQDSRALNEWMQQAGTTGL